MSITHWTSAIVAGGMVLQGSLAFAQAPPPPPSTAVKEHFGIGASGALGFPGPMVAVRVSAPLAPRAGFDVDVGRAREAGEARSGVGAFVRWLRSERAGGGTSDYGIFGLLLIDSTRRLEIRFPGETVIREERRKRLSGQFGYGVDWQSPRGARVGLEVVGGGSEMAGPRLFARIFAVWGPAAGR